jgi:hypothetical protein
MYAAVVLGIMIYVSTSCCSRGYTTDPGTPSFTIESLMIAAETGDVDLYLSILPSKLRQKAEAGRSMMGDNYDETMRQQMDVTASQIKGASVTGETIKGDKATVTVLKEGQAITILCIRESDGWKLGIGH